MKKRMNRLVCMLLTIVMLLGLLPTQAFAAGASTASPPTETKETTAATNPFNDVDETDWFYDGVQYARVNGFFSGTSAEKFNASGTMTRGMFVTVLGRMAGINPADYAGDSGFSDVPSSAYYAPYVNWAAKYGITTGSGDGTFSPDTIINREQMAVFFVRYFEAFGVELKTETNITTIPEDIDSVSPYARDAVLKLWKTGLLNGDGKDFNPKGNASRAQAAVVCMRTDKVVDTWYTEPGVPSTRVSVDPKAEQPAEEKPQTPTTGGSSGSGNGGGGSNTTYYEVKFAMGTGEDGTGVTLPDTKTYAANTKITSMPTPYKQNVIFLNWYYDAAMTQVVSAGDAISRNMTLYAKMADGGQNLAAVETPNYITKTEVGTDFFFKVKAADAAAVNSALTICNITQTNAEVTYSVSGSAGVFTVTPAGLKDGQTYQAQLAEDSAAIFVDDDGTEQPSSIRELNFLTAKEDVLNLSLNSQIKYIPNTSVSDMTGTALDGLFTASVAAQSETTLTENKTEGTFVYTGNDLQIGDTAAIYAGTRPDERGLETTGTSADGQVAYVTITAINGNTYTYQTADSTDVLFTPDILPVSNTADTDGATDNSSITVPLETMDFTSDAYTALGLDSQTTIDVRDYILFYTGTFGSTSEEASYAEITAVTKNDEAYIIDYKAVSEDTVMSAMDLYSTRNDKVELTDQQIKDMEADMETQALESGFADDAARYLTALALETDGFRELSDDFDLDLSSYSVTTMDGEPLQEGELALMAGGDVKTDIDVEATVAAGKALQHFEDKYGVRAELALTIKITIKDKVEINVTAVFEQEILLNLNTSGGAIWKWKWIFPYIYDYSLNANFEVGTFTGIGITATAKTVGEEDEAFDWKPVTGNKYEQKILDIGKQITDLMDAKEQFLGEKMVDQNGEEVEWNGAGGGGLAEKYANMIEEADTTWIELFRQEIFSSEGQVDPFHILCYGISADFVVSANMYVTLGMTFEYAVAKQYNFSIMLFHKQSTNETIDLEESHYQFDFYVMGTLGIRAGVELEVAVGLFSLKLDSIGIAAEAGAYAQLWGYFYYSLSWSESQGKESSYSGAMLIEIGMYLKISFKAQLFSSDKLTYQPTLYENQWPLWHVGEQKNVYDFNLGQDDKDWSYEITTAKTFTLPTTLFDMKAMDMQTGEISGTGEDNPPENFDDRTESHFTITFSDPKMFQYNPLTNTITIKPKEYSVEEAGEMTITWKNGALAFTSKPISRTLSIVWTDPANARYISFDAGGGSNVNMIVKAEGAPITWPENPVKQGYVFAGWYADAEYTQEYDTSGYMPTFDTGTKGMSLFAKWTPATDTPYKVEYYEQRLNGQYDKILTPPDGLNSAYTGTTEQPANVHLADAKSHAPTGFSLDEAASAQVDAIAANGSTVAAVYYKRNTYAVSFIYGALADGSDNTARITYTAKYGATVFVPTLALGGYTFAGFDGLDGITELVVRDTGIYSAKWTPNTDTPYRVEYYLQRATGNGYETSEDNIEYRTGTTGSEIYARDLREFPGLTYKNATVYDPKTQKDVDIQGKTTIRADGKTVLKINYSRNSYALTFKNRSDTFGNPQSILYGAPISSPSDTPTKAGYTFEGWYGNAECTDSPFNFSTRMPAENLTLYAKMVPAAQSITVRHFVMGTNGAYPVAATKTTTLSDKKTGDKVTLADCKDSSLLVENGITYAEGKINGAAVAEYTILASGNSTLDLYYARAQHTLTWDFDGGTPSDALYTAAGDVYYGAAITKPTLTKSGYTLGWSSAATTMPAADLTVTAVWAGASDTAYTVQHYQQNANNDNYTLADTENLTGTTGGSVTAAAKTYANFTLNSSAIGTVQSGTIAADGSLVLKLYYDRDSFTVTYDAKGGTMPNGGTTRTVRYGATLPTVTPTRTGFGFDGWYENTDLSTALRTTMPAQNLNAYAKWVENQHGYTVEHYVMDTAGIYQKDSTDSKTGSAGASLTLSALKKSNLEVTNAIVYTEAKVGEATQTTVTIPDDESLVIKLYYERKQFQLTWNLGGGTASNAYTQSGSVYYGATITKPELTKTGYSYAWNAEPVTTMPAEAKTYTANWTANSYTVTFHNGSASSTQNFTYGEEKALTANSFVKTGNKFLGWATSASGENIHDDQATVSNLTAVKDGNIDLYAVWQVQSYTVSYELNGGTQNANNPSSYTYGTGATLYNPTRDGYTFAGWYLSNSMVTNISASKTGDLTLYAKWTAINYSITYVLSGGTASNPASYTVESNAITLTNPTMAGANFISWSGTGLTGANNTSVTIPVASTGNRTYTANWSYITYTITYDTTGIVDDANNQLSYQVNTATFALADGVVTAEGTHFVGWYDQRDGEGTLYTEIKQGTTGNLTLYPYVFTGVLVSDQQELADALSANDKDIMLTASFSLTDWTTAYDFNHKFNARGNTITYDSGCTAPVFDTVGTSGTVKNLHVSGTVGGNGLANMNKGLIENCTAANLTIIGNVCCGFVGENQGTISYTKDATLSNVTITSTANPGSTAGILVGQQTGENSKISIAAGCTLTLSNISIDAYTEDTPYFHESVGGLIGGFCGGTLENAGKVNISGDLRGKKLGGVIGYCEAPVTIENFETTIAFTEIFVDNQLIGTGLLMGYAFDPGVTSITVSNCTIHANAARPYWLLRSIYGRNTDIERAVTVTITNCTITDFTGQNFAVGHPGLGNTYTLINGGSNTINGYEWEPASDSYWTNPDYVKP